MSETEQAVTLLPCPLFGHQPLVDWATRATGPGPYLGISGAPIAIKFYSIICPGCCSTASFESRERAIAAWNTRSASVVAPQGDALKAIAEEILNYLNFDCSLEAVQEDARAIAYIVFKNLTALGETELLQRLVRQLEFAVQQGYQPNLLDISDGHRQLTDTAYADGYGNGFRYGKQSRTAASTPVAPSPTPAPVTAPVSTGEQPPHCVKCGHDAGIERTLKRCKARTDGGEALCQCHCVFPAATSTTPDDGRQGVQNGICPDGCDGAAKECALCAEIRRWQDAIRDKLIDLGAPDWKIDGAGCDSGDPLDFTLAEVGQGVGYFIDQLDELRAATPPPVVTAQVQCADCLAWIDRDANHTCQRQVRSNQRKAAQ